MELKEIKKEYEKLAMKYKLPGFGELNENFEIEKIEIESDTFLRAVRKIMMEKIVNSLGFIEMLLNPMNAPRMYLNYLRVMTLDDKNSIDKIYSSFADLSVLSLEREVDYDEKAEAELIKKIVKTWNEAKPEFRKILTNIKKPNSTDLKKEKSYYG